MSQKIRHDQIRSVIISPHISEKTTGLSEKNQQITFKVRFDSNKNDQKRVMTPKEAFKNGSDWLVIGRPITKGNVKKNIQTLIDHLNK